LLVAVSFARAGIPVVGFDGDATRIAELNADHDRTGGETVDLRPKMKLDRSSLPAGIELWRL
jgi:UDP-N-acetyl-D-mannosaminuronate dehydrogenase